MPGRFTQTKDDNLLAGCLLVLAAAIPISIGLAETSLFLALVAGAISFGRGRTRISTDSAFLLPIGLFVLVAIGSILWGERPEVSLGRAHRLAFPGLILLLGMRSSTGGGWPVAWLWRSCGCFLAGVAVLGLYDLVRIPMEVNRGVAWFDTGNMRDPQMYLVSLCILAGLWICSDLKRWRPFMVMGTVLSLVGLVLHFKRGVWMSLVFALLLYAGLTRRWKVLGGLVIVVALVACLPPVQQRIGDMDQLFNRAQGDRYALWTEVAPSLIADHPMGLGWGAVQHSDLAERAEFVQPKLNHLHNNILQVTAEVGWLGLSAWLLWMGTALLVLGRGIVRDVNEKAARAPLRLGLYCGFAGLMVNGLVEYNFGDSEVLLLMCLLMGWAEWIRVSDRSEGNRS